MNTYDIFKYEKLKTLCHNRKIRLVTTGSVFRLTYKKRTLGEFATVNDTLLFIFGFDSGMAAAGEKDDD
jgi:hypothetical protein